MSLEDFEFWKATDLVAAFTEKTLSPVEVVKASLARAQAVQARCNPITEFFAETALQAAQRAEARYAGNGPAPRPLEGVPLAVKEEFAMCGSTRSSGSLLFADRVDEHTDVYVQRLLDGGAIPTVKTTTPEFCLLGSTWSRRYGVTTNPWNNTVTCGGSSGGSGVSLAAGITPIATGTDIGGSIRIPASACGVFGYKPPYGRNPEVPVFNLDYYSHSGPMARSVADIITMQDLTAGQHPTDIASLPKPPPHINDPECLKGMRVAMTPALCGYEIDHQVAKNFAAACQLMVDAGALVEEVDLGWPDTLPATAEAYLSALWGATLQDAAAHHGDELCPYSFEYAKASLMRSARDIIDANDVAWNAYASLGPIMERFDILVCPTNAATDIPADYGFPNSDYRINGNARSGGEDKLWLTSPFNMLSRLPVMSVPTGFGTGNVPTGMQIVGRAYDDSVVLNAALGFERLLPWLFDSNHRPTEATKTTESKV
jgi:Asp-tRNA(Asn)/Glu-tRNA(Gln) amidotransferase A subunit family amidase